MDIKEIKVTNQDLKLIEAEFQQNFKIKLFPSLPKSSKVTVAYKNSKQFFAGLKPTKDFGRKGLSYRKLDSSTNLPLIS